MRNIEVTDELLYKYMPIADEMELDALEAELEEYEFTEAFERKMKRLMWKEKHRWLKDLGKFMARVAVVLLCILGVGFVVTMSVDAYRSKFFQTVQEIWEDAVIHTYDAGEDEQGFVPHEPTYIPEGYVEVDRIETEQVLSISYQNKNNNIIFWDQYMILDGSQQILDMEYIEKEVKKVDSGVITIYLYEGDIIKAYYETEKYVIIITTDSVDIDEIYSIMQSME